MVCKYMSYLLLISLLTPLASVGEQRMVDPMRPPSGKTSILVNKPASKWVLTAILVSPERRLAMINNRLVAVGDRIGGAKVREIRGSLVELEVDGRKMWITPRTYPVRRQRRQ